MCNIYQNLLRVYDAVAAGPFCPHLFLAEMVMVKVVLGCTLLGFSATVNIALVLLPLTVIPICCTPDVEDTLIS